MNEKEAVMAKVFSGGFPGQALGQGKPPFAEGDFQPGEAPPVDFLGLPVTPDKEPTFEPATGLPILPPEHAFNHAPFDEENFSVDLPDFPDFF